MVVERQDFGVVFDESYTWRRFGHLGNTVTVTSLQTKQGTAAVPTTAKSTVAVPTATPPATSTPWRVIAGDRTAPGVFNEVTAVAVDSQGNMYVGDKWNSRVQKLSPDGKPLAQWGTRGSGPGQFLSIVSIALDRQGNIYVLDARLTTDSRHVDGQGNNRIQKLSPEGKPVAQWGTEGKKPGQFFLPASLAVDSHGYIYVADTGNNRIQKLSPEGEPVAQWGAGGEGGRPNSGPSRNWRR